LNAAAGPGGREATHGSNGREWPPRWASGLDKIAATDVEAMRHEASRSALSRRNSRSGRHAAEYVIAAARAMFTRSPPPTRICDHRSHPDQARPVVEREPLRHNTIKSPQRLDYILAA
jgi:hypothetical protein